jgi:hypothetical protein
LSFVESAGLKLIIAQFVSLHESLSPFVPLNSITSPDGLDPFLKRRPSTIRFLPEIRRFEDPEIITPPYDSARKRYGAVLVPKPLNTTAALDQTPFVMVSVSPGRAVVITVLICDAVETR